MTINKLKSYIDRTLGNSLRCLLPSYWWKRLFHATADVIEEEAKKTADLIAKVQELERNKADAEDIILHPRDSKYLYDLQHNSINLIWSKGHELQVTLPELSKLNRIEPIFKTTIWFYAVQKLTIAYRSNESATKLSWIDRPQKDLNALNVKSLYRLEITSVRIYNTDDYHNYKDHHTASLVEFSTDAYEGEVMMRNLYAKNLFATPNGYIAIKELTDEEKAYNAETKRLFLAGKTNVRVSVSLNGTQHTPPLWYYYDYYNTFYFAIPNAKSADGASLYIDVIAVRVNDDGSATWEQYVMKPDLEVTKDSYNAVSSSAVKTYVDNAILSAITTTLNTSV